VRCLDEDTAARGVVTHSSGNFAQALALAARLRGIPAHIVMPRTAPSVKRAAVAGYGGRIVLCEPNLDARTRTAAAVVEETGGALLHPYDHLDVIAGQGTAGLELVEQLDGRMDAVIAPVGGGGLVGGVAVAVKGVLPGARVFAAEPRGADDAARSKAAGEWILQTAPDTIADGLLTSLGEHTWPLIRDVVDGIFVVEEAEIERAMRLVWERMKLVVEPSAAVPVAAVLSKDFVELPGLERVGVILSGGNVDLERLPWS